MPVTKEKPSKLSMVPVRAESEPVASDYTFECIRKSIRTAETMDNHYRYGVHAERDAIITQNWESLPIYLHGDHASMRELFNNFKKTVSKVL
jgi:hypothetical protein